MPRSTARRPAIAERVSMRTPAQGALRGPGTASDIVSCGKWRSAETVRPYNRSGVMTNYSPSASLGNITNHSASASLGNLLRRPEIGSLLGLLAVFVFFAVFGGTKFASVTGAASWLNVAANIGIVAIPIGLLMIAGELDISIGSIIPASSMTIAIISGHYEAPTALGAAAALALGAVVGLINGILVIRTAVPSLIVTLGTLFAVAGLLLGLSVIITGT